MYSRYSVCERTNLGLHGAYEYHSIPVLIHTVYSYRPSCTALYCIRTCYSHAEGGASIADMDAAPGCLGGCRWQPATTTSQASQPDQQHHGDDDGRAMLTSRSCAAQAPIGRMCAVLAAAGVCASAASPSSCTFIHGIDFFIPNGQPSGSTPNASACCDLCRGTGPASPVLPPVKKFWPYFTWNSNGNGCYCKLSEGSRRNGSGLVSGACGSAPSPPPGPPSPTVRTKLVSRCQEPSYCTRHRSGPSTPSSTRQPVKSKPHNTAWIATHARVRSIRGTARLCICRATPRLPPAPGRAAQRCFWSARSAGSFIGAFPDQARSSASAPFQRTGHSQLKQ